MLSLDRLGFARNGKTILRDISARFAPGSVVAVLGPSGSGKSTLFKLIAGFLVPGEGEIRHDETVIASPIVNLPPHRRSTAMAFQHLALWPHMRVGETLEFVLQGGSNGGSQASEAVRQLLEDFNLTSLAHRFPSQISGGEGQALNLARAMAMEPKILLLDEPFSGMDPMLKTQLLRRIEEHHERHQPLILAATHYAREILSLADDVLLLKEGRIHFSGSKEEFCASQDPYLQGFLEP